MKENKKYWVKKLFYDGGIYSVLITSMLIVTNSSFSFQWIYSLACSIICFISIALNLKILGVDNIDRKQISLLSLLSIAELILAFIYRNIFIQNTPITMWIVGSLFLSPVAYLGAYRVVLSTFFPKAIKVIATPPPDPLTELPQVLQEIINKGRLAQSGTAGVTMMVFFFVGGIGGLFVFRDDEYVNFVLICILLGFIFAAILSIIATYRWRTWAMKSGIPEDKLRTAAKIVGLWFPKTKK